MRWDEFLDTSDRLVQGQTEGDWRSAVSRAYYAVFHYFRELFLLHGLDLGRGGQCHFNLHAGLLHCGFAQASRFGSRIDELRAARVWADYDFRRTLDHRSAVARVQHAHKLTADFQNLSQSIAPAQIVAGARQHLQTIGKLGKTP